MKVEIPKRNLWIFLILIVFVSVSCLQNGVIKQPPANNALNGSSSDQQDFMDSPDVEKVAHTYLSAWRNGDYASMYALLTPISQNAISEEEFTQHYQGIASEALLSGVDYKILSSLTNSDTAQVSYRVILESSLVGEIQADTLMNLSLEDDEWRIQWDDTLVLPQLRGGNYLHMDRSDFVPSRANIYDRYGKALVAQVDATAIGLIPDQIDPEQEQALLTELAEMLDMTPQSIKALYANYPVGAGWYLPLGEVSADEIASRYDDLSQFKGLVLKGYKARYYFDGGVASHLVGYVSAIQPEELDYYVSLGYSKDDRVGRSGLEKWGEKYLAGRRGGALYVLDVRGQPVTRLAETEPQAGQSIYTTLEKDFQQSVEQAMSGFRGAVVVLERDTGRVLAMASSPDFNPNAFEPINYNSEYLLAALQSQDRPLFNRATLGQYPLGSVFKIITMAAALESGIYTPNSTYYCGHKFEEIPGVTLYDWTYEYKFPPSGMLNLPGGLIRSCNPWFYHIGLDLYKRGQKSAVTEMAKGFGLGSLTGIEGVEETAGQILPPTSPVDATNQAIGQGSILVIPLQVADFIAAIGNGGTIYRPQVIEGIKSPDQAPSRVFQPEVIGKLPVSNDTLGVIQDALIGVVQSTNPRGTAQHVFTGLDIPVAGKTGTAQTGGAPHAWFAGYTYAEREDRPDIAVVVIVENSGEGSDYAAPIFRRIVELYYFNRPGKLYDWETTYNVTRTPAPNEESTPTPSP